MAAIDPQVLLEEAKCYACFAQSSLPDLLKLALLARISEGSGGGGTPGGLTTQVQYNNAGAFAGNAGLTFNSATNALAIGGSLTVGVTVSVNGATGSLNATTLSSLGAISAGTTLDAGSAITAQTTVRTGVYTVATLPAAGTVGRRACVTNALAPAFLAIVAGGGAVRTPVFDNGTNWVCG